MAFREKAAWISLFVTLFIWGSYFGDLMPALGADYTGGGMLDKFLSTVALAVVLQIVLSIILAIASPKDANAPADERERLIALRATTLAYHVLTAMLMVVVIGAPIISLLHAHRSGTEASFAMAVLPMANGVVLSVVLGEVAKYLWQIVQYRRDSMS